MKNLNAQTVGIGILLAALAVSCSPVVKVKAGDPALVKTTGSGATATDAAGKVAAVGDGVINTVGDKKEDAASIKTDAAATDAKAALDKQSLNDQAIKALFSSMKDKLQADCLLGKRSVEKDCKDEACDVLLNITCVGPVITDEEVRQAISAALQAVPLPIAISAPKSDSADAAANAAATGAAIGAAASLAGAGGAGAAIGAAAAVAAAASAIPSPTASPQAPQSDMQNFYRISVKGTIDYSKSSFTWDAKNASTTKILVKSGDWQATAN